MKNIILIISLLFYSFSVVNAQKYVFFKSPWKGDVTVAKESKGGLNMPTITVPERCWHMDASLQDISIYKDVQLNDANKTIWCSFLALKEKGNSHLGLSFEKDNDKKILVEAGVSQTPQLIVVRIDYSEKTDRAYIFYSPTAAAVPDLENAVSVLSGDFDFNRIRILAEKGSKGMVSDVFIGTNYHDVVRPNKLQVVEKEGQSQTVLSWKKEKQALWVQTSGGTLFLQPYDIGSVHVMFGSELEIENNKSFAVTQQPDIAEFDVEDTRREIILRSSCLSVTVNKKAGYISLLDKSGKLLLKEWPEKARMNVHGDSVNAYCRFQLQDEEALYGLGQFRDNLMNLRNAKRELVQFNTQAAVPVIYSTGKWGLFWDNPSRTIYADNNAGMSFVSDYGRIVNYYLFVGDGMDKLVAAYRSLTGVAPMLPAWALGYHQSRNRYATQKEVMEVAKRMKEENIPASTIFIDYHYWGKYGTGSHKFDETIFPDVPAMVDSLHNMYDLKVVLTMWPSFKPGIPNYNEMSERGYILEGARAIDGYIYDTFNPGAAKMYWDKVVPLVDLNIDGWFLDGPEPDHIASFLPLRTYAGEARRVRNIYPLVHASHFYDGITKARPNLRPYMLTRCAWASQQKWGTAVWSGDIPTTFEELQKQVAAGLNFTATGIPYWTTDIGGYSGGDPSKKDYQELFIRWFQYGTFCPIFRAHGRRYPGDTKAPNELWAYGPEVQRICTDFIKLRYRLLPYIYTLSDRVTREHYTPMRLLAFDFPQDEKVLDCKDQFMYGPALLVCPILEAGATSRSVYLPEGHTWFDFWTGKKYQGGITVMAEAPLSTMPLFVKAGSIIPYYMFVEKNINTDIPLEIHVFTGEDAIFNLYEDDGETIEYKEGKYNVIPFKWNDCTKELVIGKKLGTYTTEDREICVKLNGKNVATRVRYTGEEIKLVLK